MEMGSGANCTVAKWISLFRMFASWEVWISSMVSDAMRGHDSGPLGHGLDLRMSSVMALPVLA